MSGDFGIVNQIKLLGRSFAGASVLPYHIVRHGNIVYTKSPLKEYPYGIVKTNSGEDGIVSTLYAVYNVNDNADDKFIEFYFSLANRANRYFKPIVRIGAKHDMKIGNQEVLENNVVFPTKHEQVKIASFLSLIDERIVTQNKVIEDLRKLKCAIIEIEYNSKGQECRIGDIIEQTSLKNKSNIVKTILSVNNKLGFISQDEQFEDRTVASEDTSNYKVVTKGDFAYNPARINVGSIARLKVIDKGIVSPMYICFKVTNGIAPEYLESYFATNHFFKEMQKRLEGSVRLCLSFESLCNIPIVIPCMDEQVEIGKRIYRLESKIETECDILSQYEKQKRYLLRQMFI